MSNNPYNNNFSGGGYFYNPIHRDLTMVRGDVLSFAFQVQGLKGQTPEAITFTCKETIESELKLFEVNLSNTIKYRSYDKTNDILTYTLRIPPYLTENIDLGRYFYDLEILINGDVITIMKGRLTLDYDLSKVVDPPTPPVYEDGDLIQYPVETQAGVIRLYTEEYISDIASAIQGVLDTSETFNTREMSAAISSIHRGAQSVWIGDQRSYDNLDSYDVEICYIIYENLKVMRVYAGTTIIYDPPVEWDYTLPTTTFDGTFTIDTELQIFSEANFNRPFEMMLHITDYLGGLNFMGAYDPTAINAGLFLRATDSGEFMRFMGTNPEFRTGAVECNYKIRRDSNNTLYFYDMDNDEELIYTTSLMQTINIEASWILGAWLIDQHPSVRARYTLNDFRFRWID